jgi:hypothetical protein
VCSDDEPMHAFRTHRRCFSRRLRLARGPPRRPHHQEPFKESEAFFIAWHDELVEEELTAENYDELSGKTPAFKWYHWDMKTEKAVEVPGEPFAGLAELNAVDGDLLFGDQRLSSDDGGLGMVPFYKLTADGTEPAFIGYGTTWKILRVR